MEQEIKYYDVIVAGGGISGAIAAIAAARCGADTLLVEQYGFLGGMLTAAGVGPMMTFHSNDRLVIKGITNEMIERLVAKGKSPGHIPDSSNFVKTVTPFDAEAMKQELEIMLLESGGKLLYHAMLAGVNKENGRISTIQVCTKAGLLTLGAKVFVDATGDADLSAMAGVDCTLGRETDGLCQPMTMKMKMRNVNIEAIKKYLRENPEEAPRLAQDFSAMDTSSRLSVAGFTKTLKKAQEDGLISFEREYLLFFETNTPGEVIINTSRVLGRNSTDPWSLTLAEIEGRKQVRELERFLKERVIGFEESELVYSGPFIGVRSSRQIKGLYTLTVEDLVEYREFEDVIAHSAYPIDIHSPTGAGTEHAGMAVRDVYGIPYRCLVNDKVDNIITVGRSISASFEAQSSIRLTPSCGAIGHAGGVAAAIAAKDGIAAKDISIAELHKILKDQDAYIEK